MDDQLDAAFGELLAGVCTPAVVREVEAGQGAEALWTALEDSGFLDALVPEEQGGAGLPLAEIGPLVRLCGYHALPLPFAETLVLRAEYALAGRDVPAGPQPLSALDTVVGAAQRRVWGAALHSALIEGAGARVLELSLEHARQRVQFGKPIGAFQAVQHQLALMAEQACAARMAAQLAFVPDAADALRPAPVRAAIAKSVAGEAAAGLAAGAHAVHGAIGITAEFDLQLYTRRLGAWRAEGGSPAHWQAEVGRAWWAAGGSSSIDFALAQVGGAA